MRRKLRPSVRSASCRLGPSPERPKEPRRLPKSIALLAAAVLLLTFAPSASASIQFDSQFGGLSDGSFRVPRGIATDSSGNVYVADSGNNRIQKFDSSGSFLAKWGSFGSGDGQFNGPQGIATDSSGNVYVADSANSRIQKFDSSGSFLAKWGSFGSGDGQFNSPRGIATDSSGNVYVADSANSRIQKFDSSGSFQSTWGWGVLDGSSAFQICTSSCQAGLGGSGDGQFNVPERLATDPSGNIYVADHNSNRIQKFDSSGNFLRMWGWGVDDGSNAFQICTSACQI